MQSVLYNTKQQEAVKNIPNETDETIQKNPDETETEEVAQEESVTSNPMEIEEQLYFSSDDSVRDPDYISRFTR